jgi:hypothetical protein
VQLSPCRTQGWQSKFGRLSSCLFLLPRVCIIRLSCMLHLRYVNFVCLQLSATDVSAQATMKGAAKCDKHCELQNSANQ